MSDWWRLLAPCADVLVEQRHRRDDVGGAARVERVAAVGGRLVFAVIQFSLLREPRERVAIAERGCAVMRSAQFSVTMSARPQSLSVLLLLVSLAVVRVFPTSLRA